MRKFPVSEKISFCENMKNFTLQNKDSCKKRTILLFMKIKQCAEPAISDNSHHVSLVQWTTCLLPTTRDTGSNPLGGTSVSETGILLLALSCYIGDPDVIDHRQGFVLNNCH